MKKTNLEESLAKIASSMCEDIDSTIKKIKDNERKSRYTQGEIDALNQMKDYIKTTIGSYPECIGGKNK